MSDTVQIVWFKRDLRVADNPALSAAAATGAPVLPLYVAEPDWWAQSTHSGRQWSFIAETLAELRQDLAEAGAPLVVRIGDVVETLDALRARCGAVALWSHEETGDDWSFARDRRAAAWARANGALWTELPQAGVVRRLKSRDGWARIWNGRMSTAQLDAPALRAVAPQPDPGRIPTPQDLGLAPDPCPARLVGGRTQALSRLGGFLTERGRTYRKDMSSPVTGFDACSRISVDLAWGALSSKEAAQAAWSRLAELRAGEPSAARGWIGSIESFQSRLHWRCHFMQKLESEPEIERLCMHRGYEGLRDDGDDPARLAAWERGETGYPFVDACMRALAATGWMNFRMRSMLVAFASYQLWLDWRRTGPHLARVFTDFEPGIHWSQMQMQSGVTGVNTVRMYNPVKQSIDQDPDGAFIRRWVPELSGFSSAEIHEPWKTDASRQRAAGCVLGRDYPEPIVDHLAAARAAKERVYAVRRSDAFQAEKRAVMLKHASRKPNRDAGPRRRRGASDAAQMKLDL